MKAKISRMQFFFMIPNIVFGKAIGITAGVMVREVGIDTWISMSIGFAIGILLAVLLSYLGFKFPEKTIIQYSQDLLGKWVGKIIGLILMLFFMISYAASACVMILHLHEYFLLETPFVVLCILWTVLCMYGVFVGIEVVVRFSLVGFLMIVVLNALMIFGTYNDFQLTNLQPVMDDGILTDLWGSMYLFSDIAMGIFAIAMLYPMINIKKRTIVISSVAMLTGAILVVIWPIFEIGVMGSDIMKKVVVVCMQQVRCAQFTKYLPRYELIIVIFFTFTMYVQSTAMFYLAKYSFKQITGIKKDWIIIVPLTVILTALLVFMVGDDNDYINFLTSPWPQICAVLSITLPLLLFLTALFRGKLKKTSPPPVFTSGD